MRDEEAMITLVHLAGHNYYGVRHCEFSVLRSSLSIVLIASSF